MNSHESGRRYLLGSLFSWQAASCKKTSSKFPHKIRRMPLCCSLGTETLPNFRLITGFFLLPLYSSHFQDFLSSSFVEILQRSGISEHMEAGIPGEPGGARMTWSIKKLLFLTGDLAPAVLSQVLKRSGRDFSRVFMEKVCLVHAFSDSQQQ